MAVKSQALPAVAAQVAELLMPGGIVLLAMIGVPWWLGVGGVPGTDPLRSVDPDGRIAAAIPLDQVIGCVVHASTTSPEPGVVRHVMGNGLMLEVDALIGAVHEMGRRLELATPNIDALLGLTRLFAQCHHLDAPAS